MMSIKKVPDKLLGNYPEDIQIVKKINSAKQSEIWITNGFDQEKKAFDDLFEHEKYLFIH